MFDLYFRRSLGESRGLHDRRSGITCIDNFSARGRHRTEDRLPNLLQDIRDIVKDHLQTDYTFLTTQLFCRVTATEIRKQLIHYKRTPTINSHANAPSLPSSTT